MLVLFASFLTYVFLLLAVFISETHAPLSRWALRAPRSKTGSAFTFQMVRTSRRRAKMLLSRTSWMSYSNLRELV